MIDFANLYAALDASTRTTDKVDALVHYFRIAADADAAWAIYFLTGNRPKQAVPSKRLQAIAAEVAEMPMWLFEESYETVGDLAETIALILPPPADLADPPLSESKTLSHWVENIVLTLREKEEAAQREALRAAWRVLDRRERFVFNKLITGGFRVGVATSLVVRALSNVSGLDAKVVAHRLAGTWEPTPSQYRTLLRGTTDADDLAKPYPFFLAHALEGAPTDDPALGDSDDWQAEWKWDGIRGQLIKRHGQVFLWSRGEELVSAQFPEIVNVAATIENDVVLDGEILPMHEGKVMPFNALQKRLGRKTISKKLLADVPVIFMAYDLLELDGEDWRTKPLHERRARLHEIVYGFALATDARSRVLQLSDIVRAPSWATLALARASAPAQGAEGLMLKHRDSAYGVGRIKNALRGGADWIKWKVDPYTIDCVLMYAQRGHGKRANLYTDYTFGVWNHAETSNGDASNSATGAVLQASISEAPRQLVTFAKAYSGLSDAEIRDVDQFIKANTLEKFGPVRTVKHELVFELAFEAISPSKRHKSGFAVRFPRIVRVRHDKKIEDADSVETIRSLLESGRAKP
jgi:DNA ligase 1